MSLGVCRNVHHWAGSGLNPFAPGERPITGRNFREMVCWRRLSRTKRSMRVLAAESWVVQLHHIGSPLVLRKLIQNIVTALFRGYAIASARPPPSMAITAGLRRWRE